MKKSLFFIFVLCALVNSIPAWGDRTYTAISNLSSLSTGDSVIIAIQDGATTSKWWAMNVYTSNHLQGTYSNLTDRVSSNTITNPNKQITWRVTKNAGTPTTYTFENTHNSTKYYIGGGTGGTTLSTGTTAASSSTSINWFISSFTGIYFKFQVTNSSGRWMSATNSTPSKFESSSTSSSFVRQVTNKKAMCQYACEITIFKKNTTAYTVTYNAGKSATCDTPSATEASGGAGVVLPSATPSSSASAAGYIFAGWATASTDETKNSPILYKAGDRYYPESNHTLYAVYVLTSNKYKKVTTTENLSPGNYLVVYSSAGRAMKAALKDGDSNCLEKMDVSITDNTISNPDNMITWDVIKESNTYHFHNTSANKWLDNYENDFGNHYLQLLSSKGKGYTLTINGDGYAVFSSINDAGRLIYYTTNSTYKFSSGASNGTKNLHLYKQDNTYNSNPGGWSLHYGTDEQSDWTAVDFSQVDDTHEWQIEDFVIPNKPNWYVDNAAGNDAKKKLSTWGDLYFAASQGDGTRPMVGNAVGAIGTVRIYDNSNWNNRYAGFIPNGYVLKFGSDEYSFALESSNVFHSEIIEYNSTSANYNVSVGIENADREYVSTDHTQEMRHIFLKDDCNWSGDYAKLAIYYWNGGDNGWCGFLQLVPGETGLYEGWIPSGYTNLKFVRFNSSKTSVGNWDDEWNETGDLSIGSSDNMFTMSAFSSGSWSTYERKGKFVIHTDYTDKNWYVRFQPHYVLHFDANGGKGAPEDQSVAINAAPCQLTVSSTEPTRTGYDFLGWSTNSDATSPDDAWDPGDTHAMTGDVTLYAVWSPATLTFNASEDANWNNANNWSPSSLPTINHEVIINKPVTVNTTAAQAKSVVTNQEGDNTGQLVVEPGQKLIVAGTIKKTTDGETYDATEANDIIINSDETNGLGALVIGSHDGTNQATVNFTTLSSGTSEDNTSVAQYVGTPFNDETNILHNWYNSWVYGITYDGSKNIGWERVNEGQGMTPFKGYCVFSADGTRHKYWQQGTLVASTNQTLSGLNWQSGEGTANPNNENLLANSWMAPIKIHAMEASDFTNTEASIYIFNSTSASAFTSLASNYSTYTIGTAEDDDIIPSMQSFSVFTNAAGGSSVTLDYNKIVYQPALSGTVPGPNRAPHRVVAEEANKIRLFVHAESGYGDQLYMWERSDFSEAFENGWDGHKLFGESVAPQLFALSPDGDLAINCIPTFEGVQMGFKAGEQDNSYTFTFEYSDEAQPLYLLDINTNTYTQITSDTSYSFTTTDTDVHNRFVLTYNAPSAPTALETTSAVTTGKKVMYDNHLFILHNGRIFSAQGAMIQ